MKRREYLYTGVIVSVAALGGCTGNGDEEEPTAGSGNETGTDTEEEETDGMEDGTDELTGVETYSGEWSGTIGAQSYSGVWQFESDFDEGQVEGWFSGDGEGDISGTVSGGKIDADGTAAFGTVEWSGEFSSDGEEISGTWELAEDMPGSGEWSGSVGELPEDAEEDDEETEEEALPEEDQVSGDEPLPRYPGSVMLHHRQVTVSEGSKTEIEYGTNDSLDDVVDWYKEELGDPNLEEAQQGKTTLGYLIEQNEVAEITVVEGDYTEISLEYTVEN